MIRRFSLILFAIALFMIPVAGISEEILVELDSEQREWLEYRCSLPDGGLILTGGMRLYVNIQNSGTRIRS